MLDSHNLATWLSNLRLCTRTTVSHSVNKINKNDKDIIFREGLKQTMRTRAAFLINPLDFHSGLVLSVVLDPSNQECCENLLGTNWESCLQTFKLEDTVLNISISSDSSLEDYIYGVLFILGLAVVSW